MSGNQREVTALHQKRDLDPFAHEKFSCAYNQCEKSTSRNPMEAEWVLILQKRSGNMRKRWFCGWNCVAKWLAG